VKKYLTIKSKTPLIILMVFFICLYFFIYGDFRLIINPTVSMPRGLYLLKQEKNRTYKIGDIVSLCIPNLDTVNRYKAAGYLKPGQCPGNVSGELKPILAAFNDLVVVSDRGISVNGKLLRNSIVYDTDSQGNTIEHLPLKWSKYLVQDEYFVLANRVGRSLDSRYYGTINMSDINGLIIPLLTE